MNMDLDLINNPHNWPAGYALPLIRNVSGKRQAAIILPNDRKTLYLVSIWDYADWPILDDVPKETYESPEAILAAGWRVD